MSIWARIWNVMTGKSTAYVPTPEQLALKDKQAELQKRIECLECRVRGLDGRTGALERRQRDDPYYTGPERRAARQVNH